MKITSSNNQGNERQGKVYQSVPVPDKVAMISDTTGDTLGGLSQNSQLDKTKSKSRYGWLKNRNIGRRTGKDVRKDKHIRVGKNGMEIFDDYLSESECESLLSVSSGGTRKSIKIDFLSRQEDTTSYSKQTDKSDETDINENADDPMIDAGEPKDDEGVSKTIKSENCCIYGLTIDDVTNAQDNTVRNRSSQGILTERSVNSNNYTSEDEIIKKTSERTSNLETNSQRSVININKKDAVFESIQVTDSETNTVDRKERLSKENVSGDKEKSEDKSQDVDRMENEVQELEESEDEDQDEVDDEGKSESEEKESEHEEDGPHVVDDGEVESFTSDVISDIGEEEKEVSEDFESEEPNISANDGDADGSDIEDKEEADKASEYEEEDEVEIDTADEILENDGHHESHVSSKKSLKHSSPMKIVNVYKVNKILVNSEMGNVKENINCHQDEEGDLSDEPVVPIESKENTSSNDRKSERNIKILDVAGNRSGSLTKKSDLLGSGSDITFNRSKKRLSYSALEESEEKAKARAKKVEAANRELSQEDTQNKLKLNHFTGKSESTQSHQRQQTNHPRVQDQGYDKDDDFLCLSFRSVHKTVGGDHQRSDDEDTDITIIDDVKTKKSQSNILNGQRGKSKQTVGKLKETESSLKTRKSKSERKGIGKAKIVEKKNKTVSMINKKSNKNKESVKKISKVNRKLVDELEYVEGNSDNSDHESVDNESDAQDNHERAYTDENFKFLKALDDDPKSKAKHNVNKNRKRTSSSGVTENSEVSPPKQRKQQVITNEENCVFNFVKTYSRNKSDQAERSDGADKAVEIKKQSKYKSQLNKSDSHRKTDDYKESKENKKKMFQKHSNKIDKRRKSSSDESPNKDKVYEGEEKTIQKQSNKVDRRRKSSSEEDLDGRDKTVRNKKNATQKKSNKTTKRKGSDEVSSSPDISPLPTKVRTPEPDTRQISTNFQSGVSMRVSRRSELLENITSGPHTKRSGVDVEMQPSKELTPCISKNGRSRKSKGRRVTICPEENIQHTLSADESSFRRPLIGKEKKSSTALSGNETSLKAFESTPVHIFECTKTETPATISKLPKGYSELPVEDRLKDHGKSDQHHGKIMEISWNFVEEVYPEPAPDGLRRSKRVRLKPVASYKNETIIRRYEPGIGEVMVGVKPSMETVYIKRAEIKRKKRQFKQALNKVTKGEPKKPTARRLSIHVELPEDFTSQESELITVVNPITQEEDEIDCIAYHEDLGKVGPSGDPARSTDPYTIAVYFDQPCMSSGVIELKPQATKPLSMVGEQAVYEQFIVNEGKVLVKIQNSSTLLDKEDSFFVPRGNTYSITNVRNDTAKLFYHVQKYSR